VEWLDPSAALASTIECKEPKSYMEAISVPDKDKWRADINAEHNSIITNGTYNLVPLPQGRKSIKTRWMFKIKCKADGSINHYKARWIARGFTQSLGID